MMCTECGCTCKVIESVSVGNATYRRARCNGCNSLVYTKEVVSNKEEVKTALSRFRGIRRRELANV